MHTIVYKIVAGRHIKNLLVEYNYIYVNIYTGVTDIATGTSAIQHTRWVSLRLDIIITYIFCTVSKYRL